MNNALLSNGEIEFKLLKMKKLQNTLIGFLLLFPLAVSIMAQTSSNIMVGGGVDLIKSDNNGFAEKIQTGLEANYFINRSFSVSGGFEFWSGNNNNNSLILGLRWYPIQKLFIRFRGLIGQDDVGLGAGYAHVLNANWRLEVIGDYYMDQGAAGFRLGVAYVIRK